MVPTSLSSSLKLEARIIIFTNLRLLVFTYSCAPFHQNENILGVLCTILETFPFREDKVLSETPKIFLVIELFCCEPENVQACAVNFYRNRY